MAYPLKYTGLSKKEIETRVDELLDLVDLADKNMFIHHNYRVDKNSV